MKEREIRPKKIHETILALSKKDTARFILPHKKSLQSVGCPACGSKKSKFTFNKFGLDYVTCTECRSLYLNPRPSEKLLSSVYNKMQSVAFWESGFYKDTAEARRQKIFAPRAAEVVEVAKQHFKKFAAPRLIDLGAGYGIFLEEICKQKFFKTLTAIEPTPELAAICRAKGFSVIQKWITPKNINSITERAEALTCFEVLEHVLSPLEFLETFSRLLAPGGLFILSFPAVSGLDVLLLGEKSNTVYPPHHINLFSVEGVRQLVARSKKLKLVSLSTPGKLDVDIVRTARQEKTAGSLGNFFEYVFWRNDEQLFKDWQEFCSDHLLSSHIFLILKKI